MKHLCALAAAALAVSSMGCQAIQTKQGLSTGQSGQIVQASYQQAPRSIRPILRPHTGCGTDCGCGAECGGGCESGNCGGGQWSTCQGCGGGGCNACGGNGFVNGAVSALLDCRPNDSVYNFQPGPPVGQTAYPYYTVRGPRDFLTQNPRSIGPNGGHHCR